MSNSYIITGSSGYIGRRLVKVLKNHNNHIYELEKDTNGNHLWENESYLHSLFKDAVNKSVNVKVVHTATKYEPDPSYRAQVKANILLPLKMIEYSIAYNIKHFINIDSFFTNTLEPNKFTRLPSYTLSKAQIKDWFIFFDKKIDIINCKIFHMYGPEDSSKKFVNFFIQSLIDGKKKLELSSCETIRDFIFIDDVISALERIILSDNLMHNNYEIGTGIKTSVKDFCIQARNMLNSKTELIFGEFNIHGDLHSQIANISNLAETGWEPSYNISDGIKSLINSIIKK